MLSRGPAAHRHAYLGYQLGEATGLFDRISVRPQDERVDSILDGKPCKLIDPLVGASVEKIPHFDRR